MGTQEIIVTLIFAVAIVYIGRFIYKSLHSESGCSTGCGKCSANPANMGNKK